MTADTPHGLGFRSQSEEVADVELPVDGTFPDWLTGTLYINGPGRFELEDTEFRHWFDPLAMVRRFRIDGPTSASYTNRMLRTRDFQYAQRHGAVRTLFPGVPPKGRPWTRAFKIINGEFTDNASIGFLRVNGAVTAVTESPTAHVLDSGTAGIKRRLDLTAGLEADLTLGHPHYDFDREATVNLGVSYSKGTVTLFRRPDGQTRATPVTSLEFDRPPYVHSFGLTPDYAIVTNHPFGIDTRQLLLEAVQGGGFVDAFESWDRPTRFHVIDRESGRVVATPEAAPFFVYHHANAFETADGDEIVLDLVGYPDERAVTDLLLANLRRHDPDLPRGDLRRYRLPLDGGDATVETLHEGPVEFPMIRYEAVVGQPYHTIYLAETDPTTGSSLPTGLVKLSIPSAQSQGGTSIDATWGNESSRFPGEPVFVPSPDQASSNEGVILSLVLDAEVGRSELVCLEATDLSERARAILPHAVPYPFHGQFYEAESPTRTMA